MTRHKHEWELIAARTWACRCGTLCITRDSDTRPKDGDAPKNAAPLASSAVA